MTEIEWLRGDQIERMLEAIRPQGSDRKLLLIGLQWVRYPRGYATRGLQEVADAISNLAEGLISHVELPWARTDEAGSRDSFDNGHEFEELYFGTLTSPAGYWRALTRCSNLLDYNGSVCSDRFCYERLVRCDIVRDVFGNPFRLVALDPQWLTSTVKQLAQGIYEDRAFDRLPILADALQDAGCDNDDVLNHCRNDCPHARGCWVVDMLLGKA